MHNAFQHNQYLLHRQVLALTGRFRIYNPAREMVLFSQQKMFSLKEDIRVYTDDRMSEELLWIKARQIIDFAAAYDVFDSQTGEKVGAWRRKGFRSMVRDEWELLDPRDAPLGILYEDSMAQALLRRFLLGSLLPQNYDIISMNQRVADLRQRFNPFRYELNLDFSMDLGQRLDRRMGLAAAILLGTIEGRQD